VGAIGEEALDGFFHLSEGHLAILDGRQIGGSLRGAGVFNPHEH
jgi:hypothetical protein